MAAGQYYCLPTPKPSPEYKAQLKAKKEKEKGLLAFSHDAKKQAKQSGDADGTEAATDVSTPNGGTVTFTASGDEVKVVADITGLTAGKHGFHIHEFGDCSDPKAASAGGHFNPEHKQHGAPDAADRHAGDLGNIEADASGKAHLELTDKVMKLIGSIRESGVTRITR